MQSIGVDVEYDSAVMNEEERARFMRMEMEEFNLRKHH